MIALVLMWAGALVPVTFGLVGVLHADHGDSGGL